MSITYTFSNININDAVQLDSYLRENLSSQFFYLTYTLETSSLLVNVNNAVVRSTVDTLLTNYTDPVQLTYPGIRTNTGVYTDNLNAFTTAINLNANLTLNSNFTISGVPTPITNSSIVNKSYVDSISAGIGLDKSGVPGTFNVLFDSTGISVNGSNELQLSSSGIGTGLSGGNGIAISVDASQTGITQVGTLMSLTVTGSLIASSGLSANGSLITNVGSPTQSGDAVNLDYLGSFFTNSAGNALSALNGVLNVNVDDFSISVNGSNQLQISSLGIGTGLSGGDGLALSVNSSQTGITQVGTLSSLTVSGQTIITDTTESNSLITGSLRISGGVAISKKLYVGGLVYAQSGISVNNSIISLVANPIASTDAANKSYVDSLTVTAGSGLTNTSNVFSVNVDDSSLEINSGTLRVANGLAGDGLSGGSGIALSVNSSLTQVTAIGTLTSLTVSGTANFTSTTNSTSSSTGTIIVNGGIGIGKNAVVEGSITILSTTDSVTIGTGSLIVQGGCSFAKNVQISGNLSMNFGYIQNLGIPVNTTDASTKGYVDGLVALAGSGLTKTDNTFSVNVDSSSIEISSGTLRISSGLAGTGLSGGSGLPLSVSSSQTQVTALGTLTALSVNGSSSFIGTLNMNNNKITSLSTCTVNSDAANKGYVDSVTTTAGTGLNKTGTALNVNSNQILDSLKLNGNVSGSPSMGLFLLSGTGSFIDNVSLANTTVDQVAFTSLKTSSLSASNLNIVTTNAATLYIEGPPTAGVNQIITNSYSIWVPTGDVRFDGNLIVTGNITSPILTAFISESYSIGSNAGGFTSGSWVSRVLNTVNIDSGMNVAVSSNQIIFGSGTFLVEISAPAYNVGIHAIRLKNITADSVAAFGTSASTVEYVQNRSYIKCKITTTVSTTFEVQHQCQFSNSLDGLGVATGFSGMTEVFTTVYLQQVE